MTTITKTGQAGTLESSDILITVAPAAAGTGIQIELTSPVKKQYGEQIEAVIREVLAKAGVADATVNANDRGALDYAIRARAETALARALA